MGRDTLKEVIADYVLTLMQEVAYDSIMEDDKKRERYINDCSEGITQWIEESCEITLDIHPEL
jgi:hypothetical protein